MAGVSGPDGVGYAVGTRVVNRYAPAEVGEVVGPPRQAGDWYQKVRFGSRVLNMDVDSLAPAPDAGDPMELVTENVLGPHASLARTVTLLKLGGKLRDAVYAMDSARVDFMPHQFKPLLKFVSENRGRILIADEVGLGKTIEAGYILRELRAREEIRRVLVVCPAALCVKWQRELDDRFGERFEVYDAAKIDALLSESRANPDRRHDRLAVIASIQSLRHRWREIEASQLGIDLLIVDEAHKCKNPNTGQFRCVRELSVRSGAVVFLTATPLQMGRNDLFTQLRLLLPEDFPSERSFQERLRANEPVVRAASALSQGLTPSHASRALEHLSGLDTSAGSLHEAVAPVAESARRKLTERPDDPAEVAAARREIESLNLLGHVMCRTRKREVFVNPPVRDPETYDFELTPAEATAYAEFAGYYLTRYQQAGKNRAIGFVMVHLQRQLASSLHAFLEQWHAHNLRQNEIGEDDDATEAADAYEEEADDEGDGDTGVRASPSSATSFRLEDDPEFRALVEKHARPAVLDHDSRLNALMRALSETEGKVVVFACFKRTLRYLEAALNKAGIGCVRVDGSVPSDPFDPEKDERGRLVARFRTDASIRVLLSSQVLQEGHDLQFCNTVINWDLPWNPMDVEQRIGRVDRIGQKAQKIIVLNIAARDTIEEAIVRRLYARAGLFEGTIGVLEPILGQRVRELQKRLFAPDLTESQRVKRVEQAAVALEAERKDMELLESKARELVGFDNELMNRVDLLRKLGRYISPGELAHLVGYLIESEFPESGLYLAHDVGEGAYRLRVCPALRQAMRSALPKDDPDLSAFESKLNAADPERGIMVTFEPRTAVADRKLALLHVRHPLVLTAQKFYERPDKEAQLARTARVAVRTDVVPAGRYLYLVCRGDERGGLRPGRFLMVDARNLGTGDVLDDETAEALLHAAVTQGRDLPDIDLSDVDRTTRRRLLDEAERRIMGRVTRAKREAREQAEVRAEVRRRTLERHYTAAIGDLQRRIEELRFSDDERRRRVIPAVEGLLNRKRAELNVKLHALEGVADVDVSFTVEAAGIVLVEAEQQGPERREE